MLDHGKDRKRASKQKWTDSDYHVQEIKDAPQTSVKMSLTTTQSKELSFCGPPAKPHGVTGLSKDYHFSLDPKLGHGKCAIRLIPCDCVVCKTMLDNPWAYNIYPNK